MAQEAALVKSEKAIAKTAEGFEVAVTKKTESLHSEMNAFDKGKNAVKSEGASASSSSSSAIEQKIK